MQPNRVQRKIPLRHAYAQQLDSTNSKLDEFILFFLFVLKFLLKFVVHIIVLVIIVNICARNASMEHVIGV